MEAGVQPGPYTNRHAGCVIMLGKGIQDRRIRRMWASPKGAEGRALALRIKKGPMDVVCGAMYFPVQPTDEAKTRAYRQCVKLITACLRKTLQEIP